MVSDADVAAVAGSLGDLAERGRPLGPLTTYRVGGAARLFVEAGSERDLAAVRRALAGRDLPVLVIGRGSNLLVADQGFDGLVVRLGPGFDHLAISETSDEAVIVRAGGSLGLPVLARRTVDAGLTGLEWAVGVPGTVGGAVRMNAGGHGSDVASCLLRYRWLDLSSPAGGEDDLERLAYGYRSSSVGPTEVVVWAEFGVARGGRDAGRAALGEIVAWRRAHQPGGSNAGSVFSNPPGDSAGRLVEAAGLKGHRLGSAQVSPKHANFIQSDAGGSAEDVRALIDLVRSEVASRLGVRLSTEVRLIGFGCDETGGAAAPAAEPGRGR